MLPDGRSLGRPCRKGLPQLVLLGQVLALRARQVSCTVFSGQARLAGENQARQARLAGENTPYNATQPKENNPSQPSFRQR